MQDFYVSAGTTLPYEINAKVIGHYFITAEDGDDLGYEVDAVLAKKFNDNVSGLVKAAFFDGDEGRPDITRIWVQTEIKF